MSRFVQLEADYFWKHTSNAYDFGVLFNTPIAFPITWPKSKLDGFSLRLSSIDMHGLQAAVEKRIADNQNGWLFPAPTRSGHIESSSVKKQQARVFRLTRIKRFELYCLRHTCLTRWAPKMDPFTLAYLAGHSDISITKRYVHPEGETVRAAMERAASEHLSPPSTPPIPFAAEIAEPSVVAATN